MDLSTPEAVIRRYYVFRAMAAVGFISPIFALFVLRDMSYAQYGTLSAVYSLVLVGGELPTGYVGDRIGRRNTLVASKLTMALSLVGFVAVESFLSYLVVYVIWGVGMALTSGSGSAWLYEVLESTLGEEQFTTVRGKGTAIARWSSGTTMIIGSLLYGINPIVPFVAAGALMFAGAFVIATLPQTEQFENGESSVPSVRETLPLLRERIARPPLRSFVLLVALLFGVVGAGTQYIQPIAVAVIEDASIGSLPLFDALAESALADLLGSRVQLSAATGLGPLYASFAVAAAVVSYYAGAIESRLGLRRVIVLVTGFVVAGFLVPLAVPLAVFGAFYVMYSGQQLLRPMVERHVNDRVETVGRATVLSAVSMVFGLVRTPFVVLAGVAAETRGPLAALPTLAVLFAAIAGLLALVGSPLPEAETETTSTAEQTPR